MKLGGGGLVKKIYKKKGEFQFFLKKVGDAKFLLSKKLQEITRS